MSKVDAKKLSKGKRDELLRQLLQVFQRLGLREEGQLLLRDILTESEIVMLARRFQIARHLLLGYSFPWISENLNVGLSTIRTVHEFLERQFDDYRSFILHLCIKEGIATDQLRLPLKHECFQALKQRYPFNYVLFQTLLADPLRPNENVWL